MRNPSVVRIILPLLSLALLSACADKQDANEVRPAQIRPAKLITLETSTNIRQMQFPAVINAGATSQLSFKAGGRLEQLDVQAGDSVEKGQIIGRLDQAKARSDLKAAKAQYENANEEFERAQRLIDEKAIARNVYEQRKTQAEVASTTLETAREALEDTALYVPFSGIIATLHTERYQNVQPNEAIVTLQSVDTSKAEIEVPASLVTNANRIEPIETFVSLDAAPDARISAELDSYDTLADTETQTFKVSFAFDAPESINILPGMTGTVSVKFSLADDAGDTSRLTVPLAAIQSEGDSQFVWLVDESSMTVTRQEIQVAPGVGDALAVTAGLEPGDVVVGAGASYLHDGMTIKRYEP